MPPIYIATRGSALALAQANFVLAQCRSAFPNRSFELKIIKTTGDKLQTASLAQEAKSLPKGLFTKELETALLERKADLAVHSLKDLPTDLPAGLQLGCVSKRADVRDVLLYRDEHFKTAGAARGQTVGHGFSKELKIEALPKGAVVATSSTRRRAQLLALNPGLHCPDIRGNVLTRIQKLAKKSDLDATILALAGLTRLKYEITSTGHLQGEGVPEGILASVLELEVMLPCVGQGAIGIEIRQNDPIVSELCQRLNDPGTMPAVIAERAFLQGMGGGCQSPVAAYGTVEGDQLRLRALSFASGPVRRAEAAWPVQKAAELGQHLAGLLKS